MNIIMMSLSDILSGLDYYSEVFLSSLGIWGALISCGLIIIESILPILPLCVFVTINFYTFGNVLGFIISWICTCIGCFLSFTLFRNVIKSKILKTKNGKKIKNLMKIIDNMKLSSLAILVAIPFTPAFLINIAAGLSNIDRKKYMISIIIGKIFMVYFWGYIGTTLIECLTHPIYLIKIIIMVFLAFIISKIVSKHFNID